MAKGWATPEEQKGSGVMARNGIIFQKRFSDASFAILFTHAEFAVGYDPSLEREYPCMAEKCFNTGGREILCKIRKRHRRTEHHAG